jgi:hypothetical protein
MRRPYHYDGPGAIASRVRTAPAGVRIDLADDVRRWVRQTDQEPDDSGHVTATFVIDESGALRIADRRSEHVACAGGGLVLSAGEMTFRIAAGRVEVVGTTNQSTGYCPEPESWPAVRAALERAGLQPPPGFDPAFTFRRCERCRSVNIVKDGVFECGVCSAPLPDHWNFAPANPDGS